MSLKSPKYQLVTSFNMPLKTVALILLMAIGLPQVYGQPETDVFLVSLDTKKGAFVLGTPWNISKNPGYDNQPYFLDATELVYSRTRNGQTDIAKYGLSDQATTWLSDTPGGSEYSPVKIPETQAVSSIRLDTTSLQRLYSYPLSGGQPELLIADLKVGYHVWFGTDRLVCTVLREDRMDLVVVNFKDKSQRTYQKNVGRSLHQIPGSDLISYTALEDTEIVVKSMDPYSGATEVIAALPDGVQDYCWLNTNQIICGQANDLLLYDLKQGRLWKQFYSLENSSSNISRLAYQVSSGILALVVEIMD